MKKTTTFLCTPTGQYDGRIPCPATPCAPCILGPRPLAATRRMEREVLQRLGIDLADLDFDRDPERYRQVIAQARVAFALVRGDFLHDTAA